MKKFSFYIICVLFLVFNFQVANSFSQTVPDSAVSESNKNLVGKDSILKPLPTLDTSRKNSTVQLLSPLTSDSVEKFFSDTAKSAKKAIPIVDTSKTTLHKPSIPSAVVSLEFVKEKTEHSPDSTYFNILKVINKNGSPVQGVVRISVPLGWRLISSEETTVNIASGSTEYIPIRVSMDRKAIGGTSYIINASLVSSRSLYHDKNQFSISKSCYVTIPKNSSWNFYALQRTTYFDRYSEYTPLKLKLINRGTGIEIVKLQFEMGSSLEMYGALGHIHFTSIELRPHHDTIVSFPIKYLPINQPELWNRDFQRLIVHITATVDSTVKKTSVNFKYLESAFHNDLEEKITPLSIEAQIQNILSDASPTLLLAGYGTVLFKNNDVFDYDMRFYNIPFTQNANSQPIDYLWRQTHMLAGYTSGNWAAKIGDINAYSSGFFGIMGRGIGGEYKLNATNTIGGVFTAALGSPIYSGTVFHQIRLPKSMLLRSALSIVNDNYNKLNTYGASAQLNCPLLNGQYITVLVGAAATQHNYNNQTFLEPNGTPIITNDPGVTRLGFASRIGYSLNQKKISASVNVDMATRNYYQSYSGKLNITASGQYILNKKYYLLGTAVFFMQDPRIYNRGILNPENKFLSGMYRVEAAGKMTNKITLFAGPMVETFSYSALKVNPLHGDTFYTHFNTISPKLSLRCNYKNNLSGFITPYVQVGYTFITRAEDSTIIPPTPFVPKPVFFNAKAGLNIMQGNWGLNIFYYMGPYSLPTQSDYYYFGTYTNSMRIMPFFQKYYFNKTLLLSSYDSYFFDASNNNQQISINLRLQFSLGRDWKFFIDNNLYTSSNISSEGAQTYARTYFMSIGIKKTFDIPQPLVKYYTLKIVCFKDINGNHRKDENEQGISDIVITMDKQGRMDTIKQKYILDPGQFATAEMVTDNFGQVVYYHIPQGELNINIFPLQNLRDVFILNGQKQTITITHDTTYYIPFVESFRVKGKVILNRDEFSPVGSVSLANIRVTATDSLGNSFPALTNADGSYILYVPESGDYRVTINNVLGDKFILQDPEFTVSFDGLKEFEVDFIFNEKKRQININNLSTQPANTSGDSHPLSASSANTKDTTSLVKSPPSEGMTYRIQIASSPTRLSKVQRAKMFKGVEKVKEYIEGGVYKYTAGEFSTFEFENATDYKDKLRAKGFKDAFVVFFKKNKRVK